MPPVRWCKWVGAHEIVVVVVVVVVVEYIIILIIIIVEPLELAQLHFVKQSR